MAWSAEGDGRRRGLWEMTPPLLVLLLLALTASFTGNVHCEDGFEDSDSEIEQPGDVLSTLTPTIESTGYTTGDNPTLDDTTGSGDDLTAGIEPSDPDPSLDPANEPEDQDDLGITIIIIPLVLVLIIVGMVVGGVMINRRWRRKDVSSDGMSEDPYLDGNGEKVPMPMFEDDIPSVMELEMEDLEKWMIKDNGGSNLDSGQI